MNLQTVSEAELQRLVTEQEQEGPHLEFKRETPRADNGARHEFAADVSALGNSSGGDIVYGLDEDADGCAGAIVPFFGNAEAEARRMLDVLANTVEPRHPGLQVQPVPVARGSVFVVRVPQSWAGAHRVKTNQHFFVREGARKRQLDIPEIRARFVRSELQAQKVRDFRTDRLGALMSGRSPVRLAAGAIQVLHLIPTQAALGLMSVDPVPYMNGRVLPVLGTERGNQRVNIDGALAVRYVDVESTHGYSLFFRSGHFETVHVETWCGTEQRTALGSTQYEASIIQLVDKFRAELRRLCFSTEMTAMWSLLGADKTELGLDRWRFNLDDSVGWFDRPTLVVPYVLLGADDSPEQALRPLFDQIWQAAGLLHCYDYDDQGNWAPQR
jgi:hypothetical protein